MNKCYQTFQSWKQTREISQSNLTSLPFTAGFSYLIPAYQLSFSPKPLSDTTSKWNGILSFVQCFFFYYYYLVSVGKSWKSLTSRCWKPPRGHFQTWHTDSLATLSKFKVESNYFVWHLFIFYSSLCILWIYSSSSQRACTESIRSALSRGRRCYHTIS